MTLKRLPDAFGNALGNSIANNFGQSTLNTGGSEQVQRLDQTRSDIYNLSTGANALGLKPGGGEGLAMGGVRVPMPADDLYAGMSADETRLFEMHNRDSDPYAQLTTNGNGDVRTGQDYWNEARNRADSELTARYQEYYKQEAAVIAAQRKAVAEAASTEALALETSAQNQRELNRLPAAQTKSATTATRVETFGAAYSEQPSSGASFVDGDGGAAVGYLRGGRRADPEALNRLNSRIDSFVQAQQDQAVRDGSFGRYLLWELAPRSAEGIAANVLLGPVAGEAAAVGLPALVKAAPVLGRTVGSFVDDIGRGLTDTASRMADNMLEVSGARAYLVPPEVANATGGAEAAASAGLRGSRVVSPATARTYLVERMGWSETRATAYTDSFEGPITARISRPGEAYLRYFDGESGSGNFLTRSEFFSPVDARRGLYLDPNLTSNLATSQQAVTSMQRSIVFEGAVREGGSGVQQTVITDRTKFLFGPRYRYY